MLGFADDGRQLRQHQVFLGRDFNHLRNYSEEVASESDKEVRKYMEEAYEACRKIITENRDKLELIAQALMERETLTAKQLEELMTTGQITDDEDEDDKHEDDKPQDGTPAMTPVKTDDAETAAQKEKAAETETDEEQEKEAEPKFNVTHYDK